MAFVLMLLFSSMLVLELAQEFGLMKIKPNVENWHHSGFNKEPK